MRRLAKLVMAWGNVPGWPLQQAGSRGSHLLNLGPGLAHLVALLK